MSPKNVNTAIHLLVLRPRLRHIFGVFALACLLVNPVRAEDDGYERLYGLTVDSIDIQSADEFSKEQLLALSGLREGDPLNAGDIRRTVKLIYRMGRYENVFIFGRRLGNVVQLQIRLTPKMFLQELQVIGANNLSEDEIRSALEVEDGKNIELSTLSKGRRALSREYFQIGFREAAIGIATQKLDKRGATKLIVRIDEGPVTRLRSIQFKGETIYPHWKLRSLLGLDSGDSIELDQIKAGLQRLRDYYYSRAYLNVNISEPIIDTNIGLLNEWADLYLTIDPGPQVNVVFVGNRSVPLTELEEATGEVTKGGNISDGVLADSVESMFRLYERRGFYQAQIRPVISNSADSSKREIRYFIKEGPKATVTKLLFPGNSALDPDLLRDTVHQIVSNYLFRADDASEPDQQVIDGVLRENVDTSTGTRARPYPADPNPKKIFVARAYRAAVDAIENLYRANGYQTVEIDRPEVIASEDGTELTVRYPIKEGVQWKIGAISFTGNRSFSSTELFGLSRLEPGTPLSFYEIDAASRLLLEYYQSRGHFYVSIEEKLKELAPRGQLHRASGSKTSTQAPTGLREICEREEAKGRRSCDVELSLNIAEGPLVKTKRIIVRGNDTTRRTLIDEEITLKEGDLLRANEIERTQRNLARLGVFQRVNVQAIDQEIPGEKKDIFVDLKERKHSSFEIGAGVSTEEGVRTFLSYGHNNLLGTALRFQSNAKLNAQIFFGLFNESVARFIEQDPVEYQVAMGIQYPRILGFPRGIGLGLDAVVLRDNDPAFRSQSQQVILNTDYKELGTALGLKRSALALQLQLSYDQSSIECNEELIDLGLCGANASDVSRRVTQSTDYVGALPRLSLDFRDNGLEPRKGVYFELLPQFLWGLNSDSLNHLNLKSKLNTYIPLGPRITLASSILFWRIFRLQDVDGDAKCSNQIQESIRAGEANISDISCVPVNRRFFAGGRATIRGFQEQTLFPADQLAGNEQVSPGGMLLAVIKTELRFPVASGLAGTLFYDYGDLFATPEEFSFDRIGQYSFGVGLRYSTPIGPLLLDAAFRIEDGEPTFIPHFAAVGSF